MNPSLDKRTLKEQYEILNKEKLRLKQKNNYYSLNVTRKTCQKIDMSFFVGRFIKIFL